MRGALLLAVLGLPVYGSDEPPDVVEELARGVRVNWTTLRLEVSADTRGPAAASVQAVEQLARREIAAALEGAVPQVRVAPEVRFGDLRADPALGAALQSRLSHWVVTVSTYHASGRVALDAELPLQDLLKPWTLQLASATSPDPPSGGLTGVILDARGTGATPAFAAAVVDAEGLPLYRGELWEEAAVVAAPFVWVSDPAHPAATRAGDHPLLLKAAEADGAVITVDGEAAARLRASLEENPRLREGSWVLVVDP